MEGRNYVIFGATGGIGSELCRQLSARGDRVFLCGRSESKLQSIADRFDSPSSLFEAGDPRSVDACLDAASQSLETIDGVAHCVGSLLLKPAHRTTDEEWSQVIGTNLTSAFYVVRAATQKMLRTGGSIVLISSAAARIGLINHEAIAAAKAGLEGLSRSTASSYAARGIRCNIVAPGLVKTPLSEPITSNELQAEASRKMHPLGRLGEPADVAGAIAWLLSAESSWVTGQVLGVDGGLSKVKGRH